jgi:hypothetical protein
MTAVPATLITVAPTGAESEQQITTAMRYDLLAVSAHA